MAVRADVSAARSRVVGGRIDVWHPGTRNVSEAKPRSKLGDQNARTCVVLFEQIPEEAMRAGSGSGYDTSSMMTEPKQTMSSLPKVNRGIPRIDNIRGTIFRPACDVRFSIGV